MFKKMICTDNLSHDQWLEARRQGIGGSDASIICGINKYKSPIELWMEKTGQSESAEAGESAYWGHVMEPIIRQEFAQRTGVSVEAIPYILQSEENPFMLANLDGICEYPDYGTCMFEAKTASAFKTKEWENGIPDAYMLQIQHYMAVTGYHGTYVAALIGGNFFRWYFIERDEDIIAMLITLEADFWQHVEQKVPPALDGSEACAQLLNRLYQNAKATRVNLPQEAEALIQQFQDASDHIDQYTEQKRWAENLLKNMLGENEAGSIGDYAVSWKSVTKERLDSKALKAALPDIYSKYAKPTSYRRFGIREVQHGA